MNDPEKQEGFSPAKVYATAAGHLFHDLHTAFLAPLLPEIISKLSLSLTSVGALTTLVRLPALINPFLGYIADTTGSRYFVILAPGLSATFMSLIGLSPTSWVLGILLLLTGLSTALFHAPSPAIIGESSGEKVGFGMSLFMAGGGLGRTIGPVIAVWAVSLWGLEGTYRLMLIGWAASAFLFWQLRKVDIKPQNRPPFLSELPRFRTFFLPLAGILILRNYLLVAVTTYLPTYMRQAGAPLWIAGGSLAVLELAGVAGSLIIGPVSDIFGRKEILMSAMSVAGLTLFGFLQVSGWVTVPFLILLGLSSKSTGTIFLALVQDHFNVHRATSNGIFMLLSFLTNAGMLLLIGVLGDAFGLQAAYLIGAATSVLTVPALLLLPDRKTS